MTEQPAGVRIETASVTDRGLNERRPLNEDSMLCDPAHGIFAVADGVGGAEAGEVASQTAIEVLGEAFRHHNQGDDAEDLLEIAIQRANDSIYRLSREQPRFSMMATTVVALHLDGLRATVAHVGDSRLYRLTPAGELLRETEDHSLVEEEVRAGRLTAQQAANHPSRNVINRALGAEAAVEVDTKTVEVEPGTTFLICSDGITRHIPDEELGPLLTSAASLEAACDEMKRLCYERGAEDNLTAVLVRVGGAGRSAATADLHDTEEMPTLVSERARSAVAPAQQDEPFRTSILNRPFNDAGTRASADGEDASAARAASANAHGTSANRPAPRGPGGAGRVVGVLLLLLAVGAAAFYGGLLFARRGGGANVATTGPTPAATSTPGAALTSSPVPTSEDDLDSAFDRRRRAVDLQPASEAANMLAASGGQPLNSQDPEFLYLYGRAMLLTDKQDEAIAAFNRAVQRIEENMTPRHGQLKIDARLATIAAHLRAGHTEEARGVAVTLDELIRAGNANAGASPSPTPE